MTSLDRTAVVLLAAGRSQRHPGQNKLCRMFGDMPLGLHAAQTIAALAPRSLVAVCSEPTRDLMVGLSDMGFELAWNYNPGQGLSSSLAIGVEAVCRPDIDAVVICLADMPFVSLAHMGALVAELDSAKGVMAVGSRVEGKNTIMPPAAFSREVFETLLSLSGDQGAREILRNAVSIEIPAKELIDFDNPQAFEEFDALREAEPNGGA